MTVQCVEAQISPTAVMVCHGDKRKMRQYGKTLVTKPKQNAFFCSLLIKYKDGTGSGRAGGSPGGVWVI